MDSTDQYSLIMCVYNIDVVEIIHGQYLKGFLLSQRRKNVGEVFFWEIPVEYMCQESYIKAHVLRGWTHNLVGLIIIRLLCKYYGVSLCV